MFWPARRRAQDGSISAAAARRTQLCVQGGSIQLQPRIKNHLREVYVCFEHHKPTPTAPKHVPFEKLLSLAESMVFDGFGAKSGFGGMRTAGRM